MCGIGCAMSRASRKTGWRSSPPWMTTLPSPTALRARKLAFISDVPGLLRDVNDPASLIGTLRVGEVAKLKKDGVVGGGMLPKLDSCVEAIKAGVGKVHLVDGRMAHSLLLEIFTKQGVGTEMIADE